MSERVIPRALAESHVDGLLDVCYHANYAAKQALLGSQPADDTYPIYRESVFDHD